MSKELMKTQDNKDLSVVDQYSHEQMRIIKNQIAKGASDSELLMFLNICEKRKLDPLAGQIWFIKYGNGNPIITASIDGLRSLAERTGELSGQEGPLWCGEDGVWKDVWLDSKNPSAAKVVVHRKECSHGFTGVALWKEFNNSKNPSWRNFPAHMLAKVAESMALKKAFPQDLGGIYEQGESCLDQDEPSSLKSAIQPPTKEELCQKANVDSDIVENAEYEDDPVFEMPRDKELLIAAITNLKVEPSSISAELKKDLVKYLSERRATKSTISQEIEVFLKQSGVLK
jgi:phage recombination protein Bet